MQSLPGFALVLGLVFSGGPAAAQVFVAVEGSDETGDGSMQSPFATLSRAIDAPGNEIFMGSGEYILSGTVVVPSNYTVRGGFKLIEGSDGSLHWAHHHEATQLLIPAEPGQPGVVLQNGARLETMTLVGGYVSAEMHPGSSVWEVIFRGGSFAAVHVTEGLPGNPAVVERSQILGGGTGIRVEMEGNIAVRETLVRDVFGRGISISGSGEATIERSVVQRCFAAGVSISGTSDVIVENTVVRRNTGHGLRVVQASPLLRGLLIERNDHGILFSHAPAARAEHLTIVANRRSGAFVRESSPEITRSIIAHNNHYGIEEASLTEPDDDAPAQGGLLEDVLFWENKLGHYLDEGEDIINTLEEFEEELSNAEDPVGIRIAEVGFVNESKGNYRLTVDSPAVDQVERLDDYDFDLDGNNRLVDIDEVGNEGFNAVDLGAYEYQGRFVHNFATEYWDNSGVQDPNNEDETVMMKVSPGWVFNPISPFNRIEATFLPGRIRYYSKGRESFGWIFREAQDIVQEADKIGILRVRLRSVSEEGLGDTRLRIMAPEMGDVVNSMVLVGEKKLSPTPQEKEYTSIFDTRQGGLRDISLEERPSYPTNFFLDLLDFADLRSHGIQEITRMSIEWIDREAWDGQFTELVKTWDFDPSEPMDWESGGIPEFFPVPTMRYSPSRRALEHVKNQGESFGAWASPPVELPAGKMFRFDAMISSDEPLDRVPGFRLRVSSLDFEFTHEMQVVPFFNDWVAATSDPTRFTIYGRVPADLEELYGPDVPLIFFFDLWGFGGGSRRGSLLLEEVHVYTAPDEL